MNNVMVAIQIRIKHKLFQKDIFALNMSLVHKTNSMNW